MSIYKDIKKAVTSTVNIVVDKTASQAQKSRLATVMRTEAKNTDKLYIQLGQYLHSNLRDTVPEEIAHLCDLIDESKERMSRAQARYREVIQQELVNGEINKAEAKENFVRIKEPIVTKAKDTAVKVKERAADTAIKVKNDTTEKVVELKKAAIEKKLNRRRIETIEEEAQTEAIDDEIGDSIIEVSEEAAVNEAITEAISDSNDICSEETAEAPNDIAETIKPDFPIEMNIESPISTDSAAEAASESDDSTPQDKPLDQEFQRSVPVDIISETEFEENEPEVKPLEKSNPIAKAMKLRNIINKREDNRE